MRASLIGVGPGEAAFVTVRAVEVLSACDDIVVDADVPEVCWKPGARSDARITLVAMDADAQQLGRAAALEAVRAGRRAGRVRLGDGWRGAEGLRDLRALQDAGVEVDVLAGVDAGAGQWRAWLQAHPLYGRRVVVARMAEQAEDTAALLRSRGAEPWLFPAIEIAPPPEPALLQAAVRELRSYQVVAFTSANGVEQLFKALHDQQLDARAFSGARVAAIGTATARALAAVGLRADIVAKEFRGEALAEAIVAACAQLGGTRVLIARALEAREVLPETLRAAGMHVDVVAAYETRQANRQALQPMIEALGRGQLDAILLTSSSTVTSLYNALGADRALLARTLLASIGPITTAKATELGLVVGVTAKEYTVPALIEALQAYWAQPAGA
jgi:uroporphyrinogen III methyltransferase/synthase